MCGIHGITGSGRVEKVRKMVEKAHLRGPDGSGAWSDDVLALGHNLLSIVDEANVSIQPWTYAGQQLVFNGEIYNYRDLRKTLRSQCHTDTDTEVLARGLAEQGISFLARIDGMYAFAWYHPDTKILILARDTNGAKPLYYGYHDNQLAFSSHIQSLLEVGFPRQVSKEGFRHFFHAGLTVGPTTLFEGVSRLLPGEVLTINLVTGAKKHRNIQKAPDPFLGTTEEAIDLLKIKLQQSVALTLGGRRQVGLFLSGGMDSAAIYSELVSGLQSPQRSYTTRFELPHPECNHNGDADAAYELTRSQGTPHGEVLIGQAEWVNYFEPAIVALEEPRQGKSHAAYYACNKAMAESGCVVTLSGDGGDELLAGYKHHLDSPSFTNRLRALRPRRLLKSSDLQLSLEEQVAYWTRWIPKGGLTADPLNDFLYIESLSILAEDFLIRNDKLGAAFSMEARFPMLCSIFRDFCRSIPGFKKVQRGLWASNNKILLRKAYQHALPKSITQKNKTGWRAPTDDWIIGTASYPAPEGLVREYVRTVLRDKEVLDLFEIDEDVIENQYLNNRDFIGPRKKSGKIGAAVGLTSQKELFSILSFAVWKKAFSMALW